MCRIFAVRSSQPISVRPAFDGLRQLATEHKDGWGVAVFQPEGPVLETRVDSAASCTRFEALGGQQIESMAVHIRLASVGTVNPRNNHPFAAGPWVFMHNGTLKHFEQVRARYEAEIAPELRAQLKGETDSERCFALFRTYLDGRTGFDEVIEALTRTFRTTEALCDDASPGKRSAMNFLVTDGRRFFCTRRDRSLYASASPSLAAIASTELALPGVTWSEVAEDSLVTIDEGLQLSVRPISK